MNKRIFGVSKILWIVFAVSVLLTVIVGLLSRSSISAEVTTQQILKDFVPGQILVKFKEGTPKEKKDKFISDYKLTKKSEISQIGVNVFELPASGTEKEYEKAFKANKDVELVQLNYKYKAEFIPNDPSYGSQWYLPKIAAPAAWDTTKGSANVTIAIIDTGIDSTHPDIAAKLVPGWNVYDNNSVTNDVYGHGTAVAGIASAIMNNGVGIASVCGDCKVMPVRISDPSGYSSSSLIIQGINWAADHGAKVANVSYAVSDDGLVDKAAKYLFSKGGKLLTVAAGNDSETYYVPDYYSITTVSATDSSDNFASWSNKGSVIDISAPGSPSVYTLDYHNGYSGWYGTSFSAPIVAGAGALMVSVNPSLTSSQITDYLEKSADDKGALGWDQFFGWGRVNAQKAVQMALSGAPRDTTPPVATFVTPQNGATVSGVIEVKVDAKDNVGISNAELLFDGISLNASSTQIVSPTESIYTYTIDTISYANGSHTLNAKIHDTSFNLGTASITINVSNTPDTTAPTVSIISPTNGSVLRGAKSTISISATDNVAVTTVELLIDGVLVKTFSSTPYNYNWNIRKINSGSHTIRARAYDAKGNVGIATVTVTK